jgi:hypothetical protein
MEMLEVLAKTACCAVLILTGAQTVIFESKTDA